MLEGARRARARETSCRWPWERLLPLWWDRWVSWLEERKRRGWFGLGVSE
jgi:hypothetical protein